MPYLPRAARVRPEIYQRHLVVSMRPPAKNGGARCNPIICGPWAWSAKAPPRRPFGMTLPQPWYTQPNSERLVGEVVVVEPEPLVSVVVVNYNGRELLPACLASLRTQTYARREVILVDNGSRDGSVALVAEQFPEVKLVVLGENQGFAVGCNRGFREAAGEWLATLNTDAVADPAWLEQLVRAAAGTPAVGMVASRMVFADRPSVINSTGITVDRAGVAWDRGCGATIETTAESLEAFGPSGGAALYRRALIDQLGGFDEDFFMYLEDVDLAWRAQLAGWRCAYASGARVIHAHSATAGADSAFKRYLLARNRVWLLAKNYPTPELWLYLPAIIGYDVAMSLGALLLRPDLALPVRLAVVRGRLDGLRRLQGALRKRRETQGRRRGRDRTQAGGLAPLTAPWAIAARHLWLARRSRGQPTPPRVKLP